MIFPAVYILGPLTIPLLVGLRKEILTFVPPRSRTVVKPVISVISAYFAELKAISAGLSVNSSRNLLGLVSSSMCTCISIQPGVTVLLFKLMVLSPAPATVYPLLTAVILFLSITIVISFLG